MDKSFIVLLVVVMFMATLLIHKLSLVVSGMGLRVAPLMHAICAFMWASTSVIAYDFGNLWGWWVIAIPIITASLFCSLAQMIFIWRPPLKQGISA